MPGSKIMPTFSDTLEILNKYTNYERRADYRPGLENFGTTRMNNLLKQLGNPHLNVPVLHIAGSKGKGSIANLSSALLVSLGYRVGLYTSPHITNIRERIQLSQTPLSEDDWCESFAELLVALEALQLSRAKAPTYFEILTALAFLAFRNAGVNVIVLEVGLGGRLDATNIYDLPVAASAIASISLDHTRQLGENLLAIAKEKAGIIRSGVPVVIAPQTDDVLTALSEWAGQKNCPVFRVGIEMRVDTEEDSDSEPLVDCPGTPREVSFASWRGRYPKIPFALLGRHQLTNAAAALALVECFLESRNAVPVDSSALISAWEELQLPGRVEVVGRAPWLILDGAHNTASAWVLAETLQESFRATNRVLVFSAAADKDIPGMLSILAPLFAEIIFTTTDSPRCMDINAVADSAALTYQAGCAVEPSPKKALRRAEKIAGRNGLVCVAGSLYLVGALRNALSKS